MQLTLQIVITDESGSSRTEELMTIQKSGETGTTSDYRCQNPSCC